MHDVNKSLVAAVIYHYSTIEGQWLDTIVLIVLDSRGRYLD